MMAAQRGQRLSTVPGNDKIFFVFLDFGLCRNANWFWCAGAFLGLPLVLISEEGSLLRMPVQAAAEFLVDALPHLSHDPTDALSSSIMAAWYLPPERHVWEFLGLNLVLIALVVLAGRSPWLLLLPSAPVAQPKPKKALHWTDYALFLTCVALAIATAVYKLSTNRTIYLLQPCHMLLFSLVYLSLQRPEPAATDARQRVSKLDTPSLVFNFYLHSMYSAWLALAVPGACS